MEIPPKPKHINNLEFIRILTPYILTRSIVGDKTVLDIGCGFGHGTWLLASKGARQAISIDVDKKKTIQVNEFCCNFRNCGTLVMDAQRLGFRDHSFQIVTCFEVLEHIPNTDLFFSEIRRVLKKDGILLLTTPNRALRLLPLQRPWNPEHLREHTLRTLRKIIRKHFLSVELLGISGTPVFYRHYKRMWRQNPFLVYFGFLNPLTRRLTPTSMKKWVMNLRGGANWKASSDLDGDWLSMVESVNFSENWPFYVSDASKKSLNFLVVSGFDDCIVEKSANEIKRT